MMIPIMMKMKIFLTIVMIDPKNADIEKWINIDDSELKKLLDVNVSVVIEPHPMTIDHGSTDFDIEATLNNVLGTST